MASQQPRQQVSVAININWDQKEVQALGPPKSVTSVVFQTTPGGEVVMTFGYIDPPLMWGSPEDQEKQAQSLRKRGVQVTPVVRLGCTLQVAQEIHQALGQQLGKEQQ